MELFDRYPPLFLDVHGSRTAYLRHGSGPPLVLLHGYAGAIWNWEHQIEPLGRRFTLFIPDLIGQGLSDKPPAAYSPAFYMTWLRGFLDALGLTRATILGHSMGAGLALGLAMTDPGRVDRLILISGFPQDVLSEIRGSYLELLAGLRSGALFALGYRLLGRRAFRKFLGGVVWNQRLITPDVVERAYQLRKRHGQARPLWSTLIHIPLWESEYASRLHSVTAPTLIIWGRDDRFIAASAGEALHRLIPGSRLSVLPHTGHLPMWERPDDVNRLIVEFLAS